MSNLGDLPGGVDQSFGLGINNSGQVVGYSYAANVHSHAFLWESGYGMLDINNLLDDPEGWDLVQATAINTSGQIVGYGVHGGIARGSHRWRGPLPGAGHRSDGAA